MREFKFRVWDKTEKRMLNIGLVDFESKVIYNATSDDESFSKSYVEDPTNYGVGWGSIKDVTIMQYTGLKDKNEKEIYEGHIVVVSQPFNTPTKAIVEFNDGCVELKGIELTWRDYVKCFVVNHAIEIIGSIHENPELSGNS